MGKLKNPINDAKACKEALSSLGFEVSAKFNMARDDMIDHTSESLQQRAREIIFYYSGHGISIGEQKTDCAQLRLDP